MLVIAVGSKIGPLPVNRVTDTGCSSSQMCPHLFFGKSLAGDLAAGCDRDRDLLFPALDMERDSRGWYRIRFCRNQLPVGLVNTLLPCDPLGNRTTSIWFEKPPDGIVV